MAGEDKKGMKKFLKNIDSLLGNLPEKDLNRFAKSNDFKEYKKIMEKYGVK